MVGSAHQESCWIHDVPSFGGVSEHWSEDGAGPAACEPLVGADGPPPHRPQVALQKLPLIIQLSLHLPLFFMQQ